MSHSTKPSTRFSRALAAAPLMMGALVMSALLLSGCSSTPAVVTDLYDRLEAAIEILDEHKPDQEKATKALRKLYQGRSQQILEYRATIVEAETGLSEDDRKLYKKRLGDLRAKLETLSLAYPQPQKILGIIASML